MGTEGPPPDSQSAVWQENGEALRATAVTRAGKQGETQVYRQTLSGSHRARRASLALLACWGLAAFSVLIPLAHFVLVPGFFIAGFVVAWQRLQQRQLILGANVSCPECGANSVLPSGPDDWPISLFCDACHARLELKLQH